MKLRWLLLAVPVLLALGGGAWSLRPRPVKVATVTRGTSVSAVYASGAVEAIDRVDVAARVPGPIAELRIREGDTVKQGDLLLRIDAPTLGFDVNRAAADDTAASARLSAGSALESIRAQRRAVAAQLAQARGELARAESLYKSGATSIADLERVRAQVGALSAQVAATHAQERDQKIGLKADAERQRAGLDSARTKLNDAEVRSPLDGTVLARRVQLGQVVAVNTLLFRVGDLSRLHLEVDVDEADIAQVRVGQPAAIRLYAMRGRVLAGRVAKIHPEGDRERKAFRVEVELDQKVEGIYPGMTAEVNIVLSRHDGVLLAPLEALHGDRVWVVEGGRMRARTVTVKQRDLVYAEIEGLGEGVTVVVGDPAGLGEGARVKTSPADIAPAAAPAPAVPAPTGSAAITTTGTR